MIDNMTENATSDLIDSSRYKQYLEQVSSSYRTSLIGSDIYGNFYTHFTEPSNS
jgi:hypothetical protein